MGSIAFFIGLGFIINGIFLTAPRPSKLAASDEPQGQDAIGGGNNDLRLSEPPASSFTSVTEHTTHHLQEKQPIKHD